MLVLAIDTTSAVDSVAAVRDGTLVGVVASESEETHSTRLFRQLKVLLETHQLKMPQFDLYATATGPGSFTGVRVGLTAVKGWAEVYGKPVVGVSALEAVAALVSAAAPRVAAVTDARRGQVYAGLYERQENILRRRGEDVVMLPAECFEYLADELRGESLLFATPAPEWLAPLVASSPLRHAGIQGVTNVLAPAIGALAIERARRGEVQDALSLDAHYVRRSEAELLWKGP